MSNGEYILNPTDEQVAEGDLDLVVAATYDAVMMVESEANELSEEVMLGAVLFAHDACKEVVKPSSSWPKRLPRNLGTMAEQADTFGDQGQAQEADRQGYCRRLQADRQVGPLERAERSPCQGEGSLRRREPRRTRWLR
jgi:polyribonucleotide nucleotidyltransferase